MTLDRLSDAMIAGSRREFGRAAPSDVVIAQNNIHSREAIERIGAPPTGAAAQTES